MARSAAAFVCALLLLSTTAVDADPLGSNDAHVRSTNGEVLHALASTLARSTTLRSLVDRIEASDVVAYVSVTVSRVPGVAAHVSFISAAGGRRYVAVRIDPRFTGRALVELLAHELKHVAEIAEEPGIVNERTLAEFYRRAGFRVDGPGTAERYETEAARAFGGRVVSELAASAGR